ncbi:hypothetical protein V6N11_027235 [Hibiscus sabdariffa]|uniref:Uncharacterized protein n=1 Tax=Hibiscus sabdariffa TaxID=183260 RepID=A0ABR2PGA7_9ROSI
MAPAAGGSESVINEPSLTPVSDEASEQAFSNKRIRSSPSPEDLMFFWSPSVRVLAPPCVLAAEPSVDEFPRPDVCDAAVASSMDTSESQLDEAAPGMGSTPTPIHDPTLDNIEDPCTDICHDSAACTSHDPLHNSSDTLGPDWPVCSSDGEVNVSNRLTEEMALAPTNVHPMLLVTLPFIL